jgi:hypothetical protein
MAKTTLRAHADADLVGWPTSRLQDKQDPGNYQLGGAVLLPDSETPLFQIKVWSRTPEGDRWTEYALDDLHNEVAHAQFYFTEKKAWAELERQLREKGYAV